MTLYVSTGDGVGDYRTVYLYWGRCGREWGGNIYLYWGRNVLLRNNHLNMPTVLLCRHYYFWAYFNDLW